MIKIVIALLAGIVIFILAFISGRTSYENRVKLWETMGFKDIGLMLVLVSLLLLFYANMEWHHIALDIFNLCAIVAILAGTLGRLVGWLYGKSKDSPRVWTFPPYKRK